MAEAEAVGADILSTKGDYAQSRLQNSEEVLKDYARQFELRGEFTDPNGQSLNFGKMAWAQKTEDLKKPDDHDAAWAELQQDLSSQEDLMNADQTESAPLSKSTRDIRVLDSDGEEVHLCHLCSLPLGKINPYDRKGHAMHGECAAQHMVQEIREEEDAKQQKARQLKEKQHNDYGIGWKVAHIPRNDGPAGLLAMRNVPQGMTCLVLDEETRSIRVASTSEPAAAVNLEYLSTALQVRRRTQAEPVFSLDPIDPTDKNSMQEKVFVPDWLAGTSAGEVLFQADYHLKELSMGEHAQPIVGMKSCFDISDSESRNGTAEEWSAREWFLVRKAEVHLNESNMLLPYVKMGVEAREQVVKGNSLEDKKCTRADHPMVKYAEAFTKNFDLIAERKSVIFHLRELGKASVLAKYLLDAHCELEDSWFNLTQPKDVACSMAVPQLWNERLRFQTRLKDGTIVQSEKDSNRSHVHGVYGGVQFGLDKFRLGGAARGPMAQMTAGGVSRGPMAGVQAQMSVGQPGRGMMSPFSRKPLTLASAQQAGLSTAHRAGLTPVTAGTLAFPKPGLRATPTGAPAAAGLQAFGPRSAPTFAPRFVGSGAPMQRLSPLTQVGADPNLQGVDLRLDRFDLSVAKRVTSEARTGSWGAKPLDECRALGDAFWSNLDGDSKVFKEEDLSLLKTIFNSRMSDRRCEGDLFVPPDASYANVARLQSLLKEEEMVQKQRREHFLSADFIMDSPGPLFPLVWTPSIEAVRTPEGRSQPSKLHARPDYTGESAALLEQVLQTSVPTFDKTTEEGLRFRIYRLGSLEVRSLQEMGGCESVGAVFSMKSHTVEESQHCVVDKEKIAKSTEYVERCLSGSEASRKWHYFVVLETTGGDKIVTECLCDGTVTWDEDPAYLEDRLSLSKVVNSVTQSTGVTVGDMKAFRATATTQNTTAACTRKKYAHNAFNRAGKMRPIPSWLNQTVNLRPM